MIWTKDHWQGFLVLCHSCFETGPSSFLCLITAFDSLRIIKLILFLPVFFVLFAFVDHCSHHASHVSFCMVRGKCLVYTCTDPLCNLMCLMFECCVHACMCIHICAEWARGQFWVSSSTPVKWLLMEFMSFSFCLLIDRVP